MLILDSVVGLAREARASLLGAPGLRELGGARGGEHRGASHEDSTGDVDGDWQIVDAETLACRAAEAHAVVAGEGGSHQPPGDSLSVRMEAEVTAPSAPLLLLGADGLEYEDYESSMQQAEAQAGPEVDVIRASDEGPATYHSDSDEYSDSYDEHDLEEELPEETPIAPTSWGNKQTFRDVLLKNQEKQPPAAGDARPSMLPVPKMRATRGDAQGSAPGRGGRKRELISYDGRDEVESYYFCKESRGESRVRAIHRLPHFVAEKKEQRIRAKAAAQAR